MATEIAYQAQKIMPHLIQTIEITADSPCIGHCTTVLGDDVCRSCLRTFEEVTRWIEMSDDERRAVNRRIALLSKRSSSQVENV